MPRVSGAGRRGTAAPGQRRYPAEQDDGADRHAVPGDVERAEVGAVGDDLAADAGGAPAQGGQDDEQEARGGTPGAERGEDMTLQGSDPMRDSVPEHGTRHARACGGCGISPRRSGSGAGRGSRTSACRGVMAGTRSGAVVGPAAAFLYSGRQTPRVASSCEPPQGRKAARISGLWRVRGGSFRCCRLRVAPLGRTTADAPGAVSCRAT